MFFCLGRCAAPPPSATARCPAATVDSALGSTLGRTDGGYVLGDSLVVSEGAGRHFFYCLLRGSHPEQGTNRRPGEGKARVLRFGRRLARRFMVLTLCLWTFYRATISARCHRKITTTLHGSPRICFRIYMKDAGIRF